MKKIIKIAMMAFLLIIVVACRKDEPTPDLKLSKTELNLEVGQGERISLSGGNGTYAITPTTSPIAEVFLKNNSLEITAKSVGTQVFTISSADRKAGLKVTVIPRPVPNLGNTIGVYGEGGSPLFIYKMTARTKSGLWLCEKSQSPYSKRVFLSPYREGDSELLIIAEGLSPALQNTGASGKKIPITREKDLDGGKKVQLLSGNLRLIVEKR